MGRRGSNNLIGAFFIILLLIAGGFFVFKVRIDFWANEIRYRDEFNWIPPLATNLRIYDKTSLFVQARGDTYLSFVCDDKDFERVKSFLAEQRKSSWQIPPLPDNEVELINHFGKTFEIGVADRADLESSDLEYLPATITSSDEFAKNVLILVDNKSRRFYYGRDL
jgi:hypothetical protein